MKIAKRGADLKIKELFEEGKDTERIRFGEDIRKMKENGRVDKED